MEHYCSRKLSDYKQQINRIYIEQVLELLSICIDKTSFGENILSYSLRIDVYKDIGSDYSRFDSKEEFENFIPYDLSIDSFMIYIFLSSNKHIFFEQMPEPKIVMSSDNRNIADVFISRFTNLYDAHFSGQTSQVSKNKTDSFASKQSRSKKLPKWLVNLLIGLFTTAVGVLLTYLLAK